MSLLRSPFPTVPTVDPLSRIGGGGWFTKMNEPILEINFFFFSFSQPIKTSKATLSLDTPASEASPRQVETSTRVTYHHKYRDSGKRTEIIRISKKPKENTWRAQTSTVWQVTSAAAMLVSIAKRAPILQNPLRGHWPAPRDLQARRAGSGRWLRHEMWNPITRHQWIKINWQATCFAGAAYSLRGSRRGPAVPEFMGRIKDLHRGDAANIRAKFFEPVLGRIQRRNTTHEESRKPRGPPKSSLHCAHCKSMAAAVRLSIKFP